MIILSKWIIPKKGMVKLLPLPRSSCPTAVLWVSVCLVVLPVGVSCMWKHVWHQLLVLPASYPMCLMIAKVLLIHLEEEEVIWEGAGIRSG